MSLSDCLSDWVGLRGTCTAETPGSGLYINDLPKINISFMEDLADHEQATFKEVWEKVERRALATFGGFCKQMLRKSLSFNTIKSGISTGTWDNDNSTVTGAGKYVGYRIECYGSKYLSAYVNYITLFTTTSGTVPIKVFDLSTGIELYTNSFAVTAGLNQLNINTEFSFETSRYIFVCFDDTGISGRKVRDGVFWNQGSEYCTDTFGRINLADAKIEQNFQGGSVEEWGIIVNFNLVCSIDNFICQHRDPLTLGLWYWMGYEFMQEWLGDATGENINFNTLQDPDIIRGWRDSMKSLAEGEISSVLMSVEPEYDGVCFECMPAIVGTYYLP